MLLFELGCVRGASPGGHVDPMTVWYSQSVVLQDGAGDAPAVRLRVAEGMVNKPRDLQGWAQL